MTRVCELGKTRLEAVECASDRCAPEDLGSVEEATLRALVVSEVFPPQVGGSGRWLFELYRRFPQREIEALADDAVGAAMFDTTHDMRVRRLPLSVSNWGVCNITGMKYYLSRSNRIVRIVRANGLNTLHCGRCLPEGLLGMLVKWRTGAPFGCYVHGEELAYGRQSRELGWLMRRVFASAKWVVANSRNTLRMLSSEWGVPTARLMVMHPGVDSIRYHPAPYSSKVRAELGWGERPVLLTVGRLQARKGHDIVIRALREVHKHVPGMLYAIVGSGEQEGYLRGLVVREGMEQHVIFHAALPDEATLRCFQQCDMFILPNRQVGEDIEGFGMVLVEAQACGKAVIAGDSGGTAETMKLGETGVVVNCDEPGPVAESIVALMSNPERLTRMGRAAREWAIDQFDWSRLAARAQEFFAASLLARGSGA